jgi:hypothetical protein
MSTRQYEPAQYLNVDLELESSSGLDELLRHLAAKTCVLHHGKRGRKSVAALELLSQRPRNADQALRLFVEVLHRLPAAPRRQWRAASARRFNIGVQSGLEGAPLELTVGPATLAALAALGASLWLTVYSPAKLRQR